MKHFHYLYIFLFSLIALSSCSDDNVEVTQDDDAFANWQLKSTSSQVIVDPAKYSEASKDEFFYKHAEIKNDSLELVISYGGGCGEIKAYMVTDGYLTKSMPPQLNLLLSFEDHDFCEAIVQDTLTFDLKPLQKEGHNSIVLHLEKYTKELVYQFE
ncbi:hypothetical protein R9C00_06355 [Flammeovirgaceae bacterium SG7u.111]|nr:hypothetical protein [Flammeovirgaceae bacterium SG7u.132]WPO37064.1 hypothetical protein R9C00_06355 [Flammeovirgaceae bacterium SG7u.111]